MKILKLRFKNLNSLYGEWVIDFSDSEYSSNGIFALTGPTGAGKSTILDAICLALYGATPRLGRITKGANEIMSRQTGECYAEVVFESQAGRFLCHWEHRRARKKPGGALQFPEHQIADADTGKPIETKKSRVSVVIEEKTGMDFDRFTRSILLAQGGFDTFLKAGVEQKSKILEQITGTGIYSKISQRVHERQRDERERLNVLLAEIHSVTTLEPEQEAEIQQELEARQKQEPELAAQWGERGEAIRWLTGIERLKKELGDLSEEAEKLQVEAEAFKPQRERLRQALKAAELDGGYASLTELRKQHSTDQTSLQIEEENLPGLERGFQQQAESLMAAEQLSVKSKEELKQVAPLMQQIRVLDQSLSQQQRALEAAESDCRKGAEKIASDEKLKQIEQSKREKQGRQLALVEHYLNEHSCDEWLISGLAGVEAQLSNLRAMQQQVAQKIDTEMQAATSVKQALRKLEACTVQCGVSKQELEDATQARNKGELDLAILLEGRLLREYRAEKEALLREMALLSQIAALEEQRTQLKDGKPCPLCGAEHHPYAEGNVPLQDEVEKRVERLSKLIRSVEDQEAAIKTLETAEGVARNNLAEGDRLEVAAINDKKSAEKDHSTAVRSLSDARVVLSELMADVLAKLQPLGVEAMSDAELAVLPASLQERLRRWQAQIEQKVEIERLLSECDSELVRLGAIIDTERSALSGKQQALEIAQKEIAEGSAERQQRYGNRAPDDEESRLNRAIADAEFAERAVRSLHQQAGQKLNAAKTKITALEQRMEQRGPEWSQLESVFVESLQSVGFTGEKQFIELSLAAPEREALKATAGGLDHRQTDLKARRDDREIRLSDEVSRKVSDQPIEVLEVQCEEFEQSLRELRDAITGARHQLNENAAAKARIKEKQATTEAQQRECNRWEKLHGLIGSADGRKYRNFAQGLTFELMVSHANRQLKKMSDRYLLIRDDENPLELNVVDHYQAGEIRSTKNLSGGESFIVSLTLALGLSKMASRKVRVDSLFLDEGFGTLDEDALEMALEALSGLQQEGKLIGVISHVSALKERIGVQIQVSPMAGGRSQLVGAGCSLVT